MTARSRTAPGRSIRARRPTRPTARPRISGPTIRRSGARRWRNSRGTRRRATRRSNMSSRACRPAESRSVPRTHPNWPMFCARSIADLSPSSDRLPAKGSRRPTRRSPRRCSNIGPTSPRPEIPTAANFRNGRNSTSHRAPTSKSPTRVPEPRRICGNRFATSSLRTRSGRWASDLAAPRLWRPCGGRNRSAV